MSNNLSRITISRYSSTLKKIFAEIDSGDLGVTDPDKCPSLLLMGLRDEDGYYPAMDIIQSWLQGSKFESDWASIRKVDSAAPWEELKDILRQKMMENCFDITIIQLTISRNGKVFCMKDGERLECDLENTGLKLKLLCLLAEKKSAILTKKLCELLPCTTTASLSDHKRKTNRILCRKLMLPRDIIVHTGNSGYYIDPLYQIIFE